MKKIPLQAIVTPVLKTIQLGAKVAGAVILWKSTREDDDTESKVSKFEKVAQIVDEAAQVFRS